MANQIEFVWVGDYSSPSQAATGYVAAVTTTTSVGQVSGHGASSSSAAAIASTSEVGAVTGSGKSSSNVAGVTATVTEGEITGSGKAQGALAEGAVSSSVSVGACSGHGASLSTILGVEAVSSVSGLEGLVAQAAVGYLAAQEASTSVGELRGSGAALSSLQALASGGGEEPTHRSAVAYLAAVEAHGSVGLVVAYEYKATTTVGGGPPVPAIPGFFSRWPEKLRELLGPPKPKALQPEPPPPEPVSIPAVAFVRGVEASSTIGYLAATVTRRAIAVVHPLHASTAMGYVFARGGVEAYVFGVEEAGWVGQLFAVGQAATTLTLHIPFKPIDRSWELDARTRELDAALSKASIPMDLVLYGAFDINLPTDNTDIVGSEIVIPSYGSLFADKRIADELPGYTFQVKVPKGSPGFYLGQLEFLMPRDSTYRVEAFQEGMYLAVLVPSGDEV